MRNSLAAAISFRWEEPPRDGRFLVLRREGTASRPHLVMVEHFHTEWRRRVPR